MVALLLGVHWRGQRVREWEGVWQEIVLDASKGPLIYVKCFKFILAL